MDLKKAAESKGYCEELLGTARENGVEISELSTHLQGQLVAVHPAYTSMFQVFAPDDINTPEAMCEYGTQQVKWCLKASEHMGLKVMATFSGALMWHTVYPWPQRPAGLVEEGFKELARRWRPILDYAEECGVDCAYEVHPGEDLHDGASYEMFLDRVDQHARACLLYDPSHFLLQQLDYLEYINLYHDRIKAFHVKDAEFRPDGRTGIYGGYQSWQNRAGRFRSSGDGEVDFQSIFTLLTKYGYDGWAILEWECCFKDSQQGAEEGASFIQSHMITPPSRSFDDFAGGEVDQSAVRRALGLE
jgi:sugar phosphate isomerase/epimerase